MQLILRHNWMLWMANKIHYDHWKNDDTRTLSSHISETTWNV